MRRRRGSPESPYGRGPRRSGISVGFLYLALAVLTVATFADLSRLIESTEWVEHTKSVLSELSATLDVVTAAESSEREFILTGDPRYRLRRSVGPELEGHLSRLDRLVADNARHRRSARELREAALSRLAGLRRIEEVRIRSGAAAATMLAAAPAPDRVRRLTGEMEIRERGLLARRRAETARVTRFTIVSLIAGGLLMLFLIASFHRSLAERDRNEQRLSAARRAADEAHTRKDQFLASVSHELRTPLTPVLAGVQSLEREALPPEALATVAMIRRNVEREARLVDDLLDLARVARGKLDLRMDDVDVHEAVRNAVETCRPEIEARGLSLQTSFDASLHHLRGDPARLEQVFWNLVRNAVKFTPPGGAISIRTAGREDARISVRVSDTGRGIAPGDAERIFRPFEQGPRDPAHGGLGLGLAIAKEMTERHGGEIAARSAGPGRGATFEVILPAGPPPRDAGPREGAREPPAAPGVRVLVVEDHDDTARAIAAILRGDGHDVFVAGTVGDAVAAHRASPVDLLVSDLGLPDGSGLELPAALRAIRPARAIALSGYGAEADVRRSREAGFSAHLVKPVTAEKLAEAVAAALSLECPPAAARSSP